MKISSEQIEVKIRISFEGEHGELLAADVREAAMGSKLDIEEEIERILVQWLDDQPIDDDFKISVEVQSYEIVQALTPKLL